MSRPDATPAPGPARRAMPTIAISDHGARVAAGRIGCTVEEYRQHEADGEFWCGLRKHWVTWDDFTWTGRTGNSRSGRCHACDSADQRRRYRPQRAHVPGLRNVRYAGPAFSKGVRASLTPEGAGEPAAHATTVYAFPG